MPRRKQEQPKRLPSHVDSVEEGGPNGGCCPVEDDGGVGGGGWYGNASDTRSESSYSGDIHDDHELFLHGGSSPTPSPDRPPEHPDTSTESSLGGCPTPVHSHHHHHRASLELLSLGVDGGVFSAQDTLSSVVSSLYGEAASEALGKPLSSNLRRLLEAGSLKLDGELLGRVRGGGGESPPIGLAPALTLSPSSHHAQQLSALARKLAANNNNNNSGGSASASPASVAMSTTAIKQEPCDPFASVVTPSNGAGFVWVGVAGDGKWPPVGCSASSGGSSLSPDSAIQKLKAAANAVLQDKNATVVASSTSSSSSSCSTVPTLGGGSRGGTDDSVRFDAFTSPFSPQSASSTLAALSKKVSERSQTTSSSSDHQPSPGSSFLSLVSMTSSAALLKEVAARAAGNLLADKMEAPTGGGAIQEDIKPLLDRNQKAGTPTGPQSTMDLLLPSTPKGRAKPSSQAGSPGEDGGKPFQCPVCGLVIKRKSYWKRHMVIHTGLKSHQCPLCPFRCARKDNLKSHMKVHQHQDRGETFQCELCPFTSSRHFSLKLHMRCHQHFPRSGSASDGVKVKEEATTDTEGEGSLMGDYNPGESPLQSDAGNQSSPGVSNHHVYIKEEPQERELSVLSPFTLCRDRERERPGSSGNSLDLSMGGVGVGVRSSPGGGPTAASLFSPDITTKTATDLLMKLSAANQKEALKSPQSFHLKQEPRAEEEEEELRRSPRSQPSYSSFYQEQGAALGATGPAEVTADSGAHRGTLKGREGSPMGNKNSLLSQDINFKVASELLMKLSESNKDAAHYQKVTVKAEPMEVDPASGPAPPPSHLLAFSTLGPCEKSEPMASLPEALSRPQKQDLFSQDISVKMASELLFQLSEKVSRANDHKDSNMVGISSPFLDERFRQSPFSQRSKSSSPAEASSSARTALHDPEKDTGESGGNGMSQGILSSQQLYPCPVCGKVFGRQQTLSRHLSLHTEERKYTCHLCPYAAKCRANLNQHLTIHSVKLVSTDAEQMVSAVTTAEGRDGKTFPYYYSCHACGFQTGLNAQFVSHMSLHVDKEQWMFSLCCSACDYVCVEESDMKSHVSHGHTGLNSRSPLSETKSTSSSLSALSDSLNSSEGGELTHANEELKNLLAPPSSAGSQSSSSSHSGSGTEEKSEKGFECVFCNFVCKTRTMYERHLQIHLITRMFECDVCHKFLKTPEQLLEHKKCHTVPTGGLKCPVCIYSTNRPAAMECHLKTHYKMEYKCRICQSVWRDQPALERHVREHRLGNHYKCEQCGYLSKTANKLIEHVRVHTGERPFHCDRCGYSCKRKDNLNLHKKLKHAPRQTFGCTECPFTTTHPFIFSRHLKKHQGGGEGEEAGEEEFQAQLGGSLVGSLRGGEPFLLGVGGGGDGSSGGSGSSSPLMILSASQALQSVALSLITGKQHHRQQELPPPAQRYLTATTTNGGGPSLFFPSPRHVYEQLGNCERAHLIPLTTLFTHRHRSTFHSPLSRLQRPPSSSPLFLSSTASSSSPPSPTSLKHSFLAYLGLGLTERAKTV
ncbi:zinc finger protein 827 isoform X1 [Salmo salar]|uniref:Zinc finger protein 827 isoform X1 n=1 Tax=Salmo salar TaxID=8030 RepID=A0ABM3F5X3_SALSA|nr:zinc finger protein 827 isoform X1 [Salmo salar]